MPKWAKDKTRFRVSVSHSIRKKTTHCHIPKPVLDRLGNPPGLEFAFDGDKIVVSAWDKTGIRCY